MYSLRYTGPKRKWRNKSKLEEIARYRYYRESYLNFGYN